MNTALLVVLLTVATLTAIAAGGGALGLGVMRVVKRLTDGSEGRNLRTKRRRAA